MGGGGAPLVDEMETAMQHQQDGQQRESVSQDELQFAAEMDDREMDVLMVDAAKQHE